MDSNIGISLCGIYVTSANISKESSWVALKNGAGFALICGTNSNCRLFLLLPNIDLVENQDRYHKVTVIPAQAGIQTIE
jgi:hypothetical protein